MENSRARINSSKNSRRSSIERSSRGFDADWKLLQELPVETLERELGDEEIRRLLVAPDLAESDGARTPAVRLPGTSWCGHCVELFVGEPFAAAAATAQIARTSHRLRPSGMERSEDEK